MDKVLVLGHGAMGKIHVAALKRMNVMVEYFDPNEEGGLTSWHAPSYTHIIIATPTLTHYNLYKALKHFDGGILVEKPAIIQRSQIGMLDDPRVFVGLIERFNSQSHLVPIPQRQFEFHRSVTDCTDNLFLELGIHDIDLFVGFLQIQDARQVNIIHFEGSKRHYHLSLSCGNIRGYFDWSIDSQKRREVKSDDILVDLTPTDSPVDRELKSFLLGNRNKFKVSHDLFLRCMEE